jgi:membrane protease YdiL (CAAX protease family)
MNLRARLEQHSLVTFFVLAYSIAWGGILLLLASKNFRLDTIQTSDTLVMFLLMVLGPSVSGIVLTGWLGGRQGLRELWSRQTRWRVGVRWWAIALLTVPVLALAILTGLSIVAAPAYGPGFVAVGIFIGLLAGLIEEIGWTGFATPRLLGKYNWLAAGCILGLLWAGWHALADFSGNATTMGVGWFVWFFVFWILPLTAYRILMTWVYSNTHSLLVAQLMHASYTGWLFTLSPAIAFPPSLLWQGIFALCLWALVVVVALISRRDRTTAPVRSFATQSHPPQSTPRAG